MGAHESPKPRTPSTGALIFLGAAILVAAVFVLAVSLRWTGSASLATNASAIGAESTKSDPLNDVLQLVRSGDVDGATDKFLAKGTINWIQTTSLQEFRISERAFVFLGIFVSRHKQTQLQQKFIDRCSEIRQLAGELHERAMAAESRGDKQTADEYIHAIKRLGEQLQSSNIVLVFQQTGVELERIALP